MHILQKWEYRYPCSGERINTSKVHWWLIDPFALGGGIFIPTFTRVATDVRANARNCYEMIGSHGFLRRPT